MAKTPLVRIAYVQFGPYGKSYPTRCDRWDIGVERPVTVLMRAGTPDQFLMDGFVTGITFQRWRCRSHTLYPADEATGFLIIGSDAQALHAARTAREARVEMDELYDALDTGDGNSAYLSDGIHLTSAGVLVECR